jgi:ABC-type multidrug transport system fused ATPase/permease subunit
VTLAPIYIKLWSLLDVKQKSESVIIFVILLVGMFLETLGVGLVIPMLAVMTDESFVAKHPAAVSFLEDLGLSGHFDLVVFCVLVLIVVYFFKSLFLAFSAWRQSCFVSQLQATISARLFEGFLYQPYTFHTERNSVSLARGAVTHVAEATLVIQQGLVLLSEVLVISGISILLLMSEPKGATIVIGIFVVAGWGFHRVTRSKIAQWGKKREKHENLRTIHLHQGLAGAKEVILAGKQTDFVDRFKGHSAICASVAQMQSTVVALPRLWMELLAVIGLAVLIWVTLSQGKTVDEVLVTLGLFVAAAFRIMPSINRILGVVQSLRFSFPGVQLLCNEFARFKGRSICKSGQTISFNANLELDAVSYKHKFADESSIREVSLKIDKGQSIGFIGESGAGKSTLIDVILGLLEPQSGSVKIDGYDIRSNLRGWQDMIGYVPQTLYLTDESVRKNIAFGVPDSDINDAKVEEVLRASRLDDFVKTLPAGVDTIVGERGVRLSGGQRQRIGIARALYHEPSVLVLDEATSALDESTEKKIMESVSALRGNKTLLIVAHRLSTVTQCDIIYRIDSGQIVDCGSPKEIL